MTGKKPECINLPAKGVQAYDMDANNIAPASA